MKAAVYQGLFGAANDGLTPACGTGNCTFPDFSSLAVCSRCANVTEQTVRESISKKGVDRNDTFITLYAATYGLPHGMKMGFTYGVDPHDDPPSLSLGPAMTSSTNSSSAATKAMFDVSQPIVGTFILQFPYVDAAGYEGDYTSADPFARDCVLYFCVQTYTCSSTNEKRSTEVRFEVHDPDLLPISWDVTGTVVIDTVV